ncbi:PREDICTED: SNW domain-containing protein 1-like [Amphimedon queenslandica]|nr:PREDICTED: SNW domain-containing protein 1-like [Amphimedon queenslandica]|eukprot:XP_019849510.1 PREDICTED: SNW domain-containing protein 1-like [Amphimedon queenslandica]
MSASLTKLLPKPTQLSYDPSSVERTETAYQTLTSKGLINREPPPYGKRKGWTPRSLEDYGGGGAFPEIHMAQYPLNMGKKTSTGGGGASSAIVPLQVDAEGKVKYDSIAKLGHGKDRIVHTSLQDMLPKTLTKDDPQLSKPSDEEVEKVTEKTRQALELLVQKKVAAAQPVRAAEKLAPAQYIRYTPSQQGPAFNSGAKQRIIRMVEAQKDPMEPPKFKTNTKIPRGPPSPPAPVLHSPPRKVTVKEQQDWKIPPCISNWKNNRGFTIALDKRLVADGRGLQDHTINDNFAKLAQSLYMADREARNAVEARNNLERKIAQKQRESKEERLRELAQKARDERAGIRTEGGGGGGEDESEKEREQLRYDRHKERERARRIAKANPNKRSKLDRDKDRDISEKIALGMPGAPPSNESMFDQRLFNTSQGLDSGLGLLDDVYNVYDKPWRAGGGAASTIYKPTKVNDKDIYGDDVEKLIKTSRFVPDKDFSGTDRSQTRDGPVQFEKAVEEDPFGLNQFLSEAKQAKRPSNRDAETSRSKKGRH